MAKLIFIYYWIQNEKKRNKNISQKSERESQSKQQFHSTFHKYSYIKKICSTRINKRNQNSFWFDFLMFSTTF